MKKSGSFEKGLIEKYAKIASNSVKEPNKYKYTESIIPGFTFLSYNTFHINFPVVHHIVYQHYIV